MRIQTLQGLDSINKNAHCVYVNTISKLKHAGYLSESQALELETRFTPRFVTRESLVGKLRQLLFGKQEDEDILAIRWIENTDIKQLKKEANETETE